MIESAPTTKSSIGTRRISFQSITRNSTIDVLRIVMALAVVYIHMQDFLIVEKLSNVTLLLNDVLLSLTRFSVPLFFAFSGYFLYSSNPKIEEEKTIKSIQKMSIIFALGVSGYFILGIILNGAAVLEDLTPTHFFRFIVVNDTDLLTHSGGGGILWWVAALIYIFIIYFLCRKAGINQRIIVIVAVAAYFIGLCIAPMYGNILLKRMPLVYSRNFLLEGLIFFTIGYLSHKCEKKILGLQSRDMKLFIFSSLIAYIFEQTCYILPDVHGRIPQSQTFVLPWAVTAVMFIAIRNKDWLSNTILPKLGKDLVLYIFLVHRGIIYIICHIWLGVTPSVSDSPQLAMHYTHMLVLYFTTTVISFCVAMLYYKFKQSRFVSSKRSRK